MPPTSSTTANRPSRSPKPSRALYQLAEKGKYEGGFVSFRQAAKDATEMINRAFQRGGGLAGISSGLVELDYKLGGLRNSDLLILAGRPSMGKSALATNIAFNIARKYRKGMRPDGTEGTVEGGVVGFFSLEMSSEQLANRILAAEARIRSHELLAGKITEEQMRSFIEVARDLERMPLYFDDTPALPISTLAARARRLKRQHGLDLLIVDYLQLMRPASNRDQGRVNEVSEISQGLKALAKELDIPVIACAQLSRKVEDREDKRPAAGRPARIGVDRAGRRRRDVRLPRELLPRPHQAGRGTTSVSPNGRPGPRSCTEGPRSSSASSGTGRSARSTCTSRTASPSSRTRCARPMAIRRPGRWRASAMTRRNSREAPVRRPQ